MAICGIVCEYNPFHLGHRRLIDAIRQTLGEDTGIVCAMSGDFVQRGEAAAFPKHTRARAAVCAGADLVLELPLPWCIASAEGFARGGVGLLGATGIVTHLGFGCECGSLAPLEEIASALLRPEMDALIREELGRGVSYAAARQAALERLRGGAAPVLKRPNDILAVEYLKVLRLRNLRLTPLAVPRTGGAHDSGAESALPSASFLRQRLRAGEDIRRWIPAAAWQVLQSGENAADPERMETALLSRLRFVPEEVFPALPDAAEGLENRLLRAARTEPTLEAAVRAAATRRYADSRLRRMLLCAALGVRAGDSTGIPPYLRVLAANERGLEMLREMEDRAALPVVTKAARLRQIGGEALRIFALGAAAADLYSLCLADPAQRGGDRDWRSGPAIVTANPGGR